MSYLGKTRESWTDRIVPGLYRLAEHIHRGTGWLLVTAATKSARVLNRVPWSIRLGILSALPACLLAWFFQHGGDWLLQASGLSAAHLKILSRTLFPAAFDLYLFLALPVSVILAAAAVLAFRRNRVSLLVLRSGAFAFAAYTVCFLIFVGRVPAALFAANDKSFTEALRNDLWVNGFGLWLVLALLTVIMLMSVLLRSAKQFYLGRAVEEPLLADRVIHNIQTHGGNPILRTSLYWSAFFHIFFIFLLPVLIMKGCRQEAPYGPPLGSGVQNPGDPAIIRIIKIKQPKKKLKSVYVLNMNSPIIFYRPEIDESKVLDDVQEETLLTYVTESFKEGPGGGGKLGKGGGRGGGWPNGMAGGKIRFIRLEYEGGDWDQNMGVGADYNFLIQFHDLTTFAIAERTESIPIRQLKHFPKNRAPPFVYLTGSRNINLTKEEVKTLRWYCLEEGGLLFADNGGGHFDASFRQAIQRIFPELQWVDIANDDIIYRQPYFFPNGSPPLWHHSGSRALGLKYNGRWVAFYHQGDIGDAWKTGHSGASKPIVAQAYRLGVNVVNYAFNQYLGMHFKE